MRKKSWAKGSDRKFLSKLKKGDKVYIADSEWIFINNRVCKVVEEYDGMNIIVSSVLKEDIRDAVGQGYRYPCFSGTIDPQKTTISLWNPNDKR